MERSEYIRKENWHGSYYELSIELGPTGDDSLASCALQALWRQPQFRGPWLNLSDFGAAPDMPLSIEESRLYGSLLLDDGVEIGCISYLVRVEDESDWLDLSIPTGMLEVRFPIQYPLDHATNPWLVKIDDVLVMVGAAIYHDAPFRLGLVGEEVSGARSAAELTKQVCERGGLLVPSTLWRRLAPNREPIMLSNEIFHIPIL